MLQSERTRGSERAQECVRVCKLLLILAPPTLPKGSSSASRFRFIWLQLSVQLIGSVLGLLEMGRRSLFAHDPESDSLAG